MKPWQTALTLILALGANARAELTIAEKGRSLYRIVIATNPIPSERYAAEELQRYLERVGGVKLFDIAEQLAGNKAERFRVRVARLPIWYVKLATQRVMGEARGELRRRCLETARQAGISDMREGGRLKDWAKQMGAEK
jgi:hypothetical protein